MKIFLILILICFIQNIFSQARNSKTKKVEVAKIAMILQDMFDFACIC